MHLGNTEDEMTFTTEEVEARSELLDAQAALAWHEAAVRRVGWISLGLGLVGAGVGMAVRPKAPKRWVWGAVVGFAVTSTVADLYLSYRLRQLEYSPEQLGNVSAGMVHQHFAFPPGSGVSGLGNLGKAQRMKAEAWKDGSKSWIDVTPRWGRKMRITHQFLGTG